ncbi:hypothetical protein P4679_24650 [Priestia megaterium]|uniref:hypothetical protein n=1 Tax=Priestia megaterium TaxID=1404 RepID=UPI002E1C826B|nr:hypothetical protein [Priestia megaterium]
MGREIKFNELDVTLRLSGFLSFCALKSKVIMPYQMIKDVYVDVFEAPMWMIRMPGTSIAPLNIYEGSFLYKGEWYFLSYERKEPVVILELEGHQKYRYVVFAIDDPTQTAAEIRRRLVSLEA